MATHAYRTRTPAVQPGLLRAAGPCRVLTEDERASLLLVGVCATVAQTPTVLHGGALQGVAPTVALKTQGKSLAPDLGSAQISAILSALVPLKTEGNDSSTLPPPAPVPSLTAAFSRRWANFGAVEVEPDTERAHASADLALAQMRHARRVLDGALEHGAALLVALGLPQLFEGRADV